MCALLLLLCGGTILHGICRLVGFFLSLSCRIDANFASWQYSIVLLCDMGPSRRIDVVLFPWPHGSVLFRVLGLVWFLFSLVVVLLILFPGPGGFVSRRVIVLVVFVFFSVVALLLFFPGPGRSVLRHGLVVELLGSPRPHLRGKREGRGNQGWTLE